MRGPDHQEDPTRHNPNPPSESSYESNPTWSGASACRGKQASDKWIRCAKDRHRTREKIACTYYDADHDEFRIIEATAAEKSSVGLLFVTKEPIQVGIPVLIRFSREGKNRMTLDAAVEHAKITRCEKMEAEENEAAYWIESVFFEPPDGLRSE